MRLTLRLAVLVGALVSALVATSVATLVTACGKSAAPLARPLLWSLEKDGATSYLLGTMHVGIDPARLPTYVWEALDRSRAVAVEADLSRAAALPVLRTDGSSLRDELGPAYWDKLEDALGVETAARFVGFKPVIPATLVATRGLPPTQSIDSALEARARQRGIRIAYLEDIAHQFDLLATWLDARALRDLLDDLPSLEHDNQRLLAAYASGDEAAIVETVARERERWIARGRAAAEYDAQMEDLLYRRNASWIEPIETLHAEGGVFVGVGAAHTVGPRSVPDLLRARGFTVTRITR